MDIAYRNFYIDLQLGLKKISESPNVSRKFDENSIFNEQNGIFFKNRCPDIFSKIA